MIVLRAALSEMPLFLSVIYFLVDSNITKAVKYRCFYLTKFLSATLLPIAVALATAQSSALQNNNLFCVKFMRYLTALVIAVFILPEFCQDGWLICGKIAKKSLFLCQSCILC
ncbi:hypothetical protein D7V86_14020 [bacterium D16-51]|nr:hypothetical protein D7V96_11065 [bacterium D16-59]RKI59121.1 hypothetical protein D7V86_14020 [bacterium D16-51]